MNWTSYYRKFHTMSPQERSDAIEGLYNIGPAHEVLKLVRQFHDLSASTRLLSEAVAQGVHFSAEEMRTFASYCPKSVFDLLALRMPGSFTQAELESLWDIVSHSVLQQLAEKNQVTLWAAPALLDWQTYSN